MKAPNILIVGGMQRNAGKTNLSERIIKSFADPHALIAVKVTIYKGVHARETSPVLLTESGSEPGKDTARLKSAGAGRVYWLKSDEAHMGEALKMILALSGGAILCESNTLRKYVEPGLFILVRRQGDAPCKESALEVAHLADCVTVTHLNDLGEVVYSPDPRPSYASGKWGLE